MTIFKAFLIALAASAIAIPSASASTIRECGSWVGNGWTYGPTWGGGIFNLTTRKVGCPYARRFVMARIHGLPTKGWKCRTTRTGYESGDVRCIALGDYVIHYQYGA